MAMLSRHVHGAAIVLIPYLRKDGGLVTTHLASRKQTCSDTSVVLAPK